MKLARSRLVLTLSLGLLVGCATTRQPNALEVSLADFRLTNATAFETTGVFVVRLQNQSPEALQCNGAVHKVTLNGIPVGSGVHKETILLDRLSDTTQTATVRFKNLALARLLHDITQTQRLTYQLDSTLFLQSGARPWTSTASRTGALDMREVQFNGRAGK